MKLKVDSFETENEQGYEEQMDAFEIEGAMEHLVMYLPPRQRVVLLLMDVFQFKAKEVGEMIGSSEGAIKALLHRARGTLKKIKERQSVEDKSVISHEHSEIVNAFIQAFNQRDPDGIASLLDDHVSNDIVHIAQEYGKEIVRKHSLEDWAKDPVQMTAELHYLWGRLTIVQLGIFKNERAIYDLNLLEIKDEKITGMKDYYFCPELLNEAAKELNIKAFARSYTFS
ncbi:sigma factor-like helix-turn-helix DNA-binding protein [Heyndrickxia sporothermodurans]